MKDSLLFITEKATDSLSSGMDKTPDFDYTFDYTFGQRV